MKKFTRVQFYVFILFAALIFASAAVLALRGGKTAAAELSLEGDGSITSPYLIEDEEDYSAFVAAVNGGVSFRNQYVYQTADLDFSSYGAFSPIGICGGNKYFYGVYDGGGYTIKNLTVKADTYGGMFGSLGGIVRNVSLVGGTFTGDKIGCIAYSSASSTAKIINCYTSVTVKASQAGGISFMFNAGGVYNCLTASRGSDYLPVNGAYAADTYNSYTKGAKTNGITASGVTTLNCSSSLTDSDINSSDFEYTMNSGAAYSYENGAEEYALSSSPWYFDGEKLSLAHSYGYDFSGYTLSGRGTDENPYRVSSAEDFRYIAYAINTLGETFEGKYFVQTADIDFKYIPMEAAGKVSGSVPFAGIYNGGGYCVRHYRITEGKEANTALFGLLSGVVYNLGLEEGYIYGSCVAGIAVNASSDGAIIFNCYSKAVLCGARGGGIADNFNGSIMNCFSSATIGGEGAPLAAYLGRIVADCYSNGEVVGEGYVGAFANNYSLSLNKLYSSDTSDKMNSALESAVVAYDFTWLTSAKTWNISSEDNSLFGDDFVLDDEKYAPYAYFGTMGTAYDPYIIDSVEDFIFFHDSVNAGHKYSGRTLKQTVDLDFDGLYLTPIGLYDSDDTFCGTYDGGGKKLENLNIYLAGGTTHTALFGSLAGYIYNLGYVDGGVYGSISAGLVYYGSTVESSVVNSYFTGEIDAYRTSGISDTFRGSIVNCWCDSKDFKTSDRSPLCAIAASYIYHSYSTGGINNNGVDYSGMDSSAVTTSDIYKKGNWFASLLNAGCLYAARKSVCMLTNLTEWNFDGDNVVHGDYWSGTYRDYITAFSGDGSSANPYKIASAADLYRLQIATSAGEQYLNQYFIQTADIDCSTISGAISIGSLNDYYFYATYDGRGNSISNLRIYGTAYNASAAFILHLGGKVINVCLRSGSISGDYTAGIAYNADNDSDVKIINCIVCKTAINGTEDGAGILLYGREADIYNSVYLVSGTKNKFVCKQADCLFGVYTDGALYDDYEYITEDECYIITSLSTVKNKTTYSGAIKALNDNIAALKQDYGMNIVGQIAKFRADGEGGIVFDGMYSISFGNLSESLALFGNEISIYFLIYLGVGAIIISFFAEVALYIRKKREREIRAGNIRRGTVGEELRDKVYAEFYSEREVALSLAEERLIGNENKHSGSVSRDAARVNVAEERKAAKKRNKQKIGEEVVDFSTVEVSYADSEPDKKAKRAKIKAEKERAKESALNKTTGSLRPSLSENIGKNEDEEDGDDDTLVFSLEDILGGDDKK